MAGIAEFKGDSLLEAEGLVEFKAPGEFADEGFELFLVSVCPPLPRKGHGVAEHGQQQGLGGMGADDFSAKPGVDQLWNPADMIDMGVGEKQVVYGPRRNGKLVKGQLRIISLGTTAINQDVDAGGGTGSCLDEVTGTGYAVFCAEVGYFYGATGG